LGGSGVVPRHSPHNLSHPPSPAARLFAAEQLDQLSGGWGQAVAVAQEVTYMATALGMTAGGVGIAILPEAAADAPFAPRVWNDVATPC